ncbi:DUF1700 domain-containing protein [Streptomyces sp. NPDC056231]|uniref:DUF1700 domain-containing protein n=1 Tax=Streptomyces sp. NPDC056231 TaxID=3345755 RepID=UPI003AAD8911
MNHDLRPNAAADRYLAELERAAALLPANRRAELLADVRSHIAVARAEAQADSTDGVNDDRAVATILRQLGDPQEIVAAAVSDVPVSDSRPTGSAVREAFALILLIIGGFLFWLIPVVSWIGWFIGLVLLCLSRRWTVGDKLIGAAGVALAPLALSGSVFLAAGTESCTSVAVVQAPLHEANGQAGTRQSALECTTSGAMPPALAICLLIALLAVLILATVRLVRRLRPS